MTVSDVTDRKTADAGGVVKLIVEVRLGVVIEFDAAEAEEVPSALVAVTVNV